MQRLDDKPDEKWVKALIYGKSGTGKTSIGVTAPNPMILLSERQGMVHVRQAAARNEVSVPPVLMMDTMQDYRDVLTGLNGSRERPLLIEGAYEGPWPDTIVIDSLTDAARLVDAEIAKQSPPKIGKDGLPQKSLRHWGILGERVRNLVVGFRNVNAHVLFLCLLDDQMEGEGREEHRVVKPTLPLRKLPEAVTACVNVIGISTRTTNQDGAPEYAIQTEGPDWCVLKPCAPLQRTETPHFGSWVDRINGLIDAQNESDEEATQ